MGQQSSKEPNNKKSRTTNRLPKPTLPTDVEVNIAGYLGKGDIISMSSTSAQYNQELKQNEAFSNLFCPLATGKGLACNTEKMHPSCAKWCKHDHSVRKFYSIFELLNLVKDKNDEESIIFKFDNQPEYLEGGMFCQMSKICLKLSDNSKHELIPKNIDSDFNLTDSSFSYDTYFYKGTGKYSETNYYKPEIILQKLERMINRPFSEWGKWEIIFPVNFFTKGNTFFTKGKKSKKPFLQIKQPMPGKIFFDGTFIPCKGQVTYNNVRGQEGFHEVHVCIPSESGSL